MSAEEGIRRESEGCEGMRGNEKESERIKTDQKDSKDCTL